MPTKTKPSVKTCEFCGKQFEATTYRRTCSETCAKKLSYRSRANGDPWEPDAEAWLIVHANFWPMPDLVRKFQRQGFAHRSFDSIGRKLGELGLSRVATEDNMKRSELAKALGITPCRIKRWHASGLRYRKLERNITATRLSDVKAFLLERPYLVADVEPWRLEMLLCKELAELAQQQPRNRKGRNTPVLCVETGKIYPNSAAAAAEAWLTKESISRAARTCDRAGGYSWRYVE